MSPEEKNKNFLGSQPPQNKSAPKALYPGPKVKMRIVAAGE
jgi:hypothetical protein